MEEDTSIIRGYKYLYPRGFDILESSLNGIDGSEVT